jgi:DNA (cytosine-5)-methyltransferase 1
VIVPDNPSAALRLARQYYSQLELAKIIGRSERTIRRWETNRNAAPPLIVPAVRELLASREIAQVEMNLSPFTFADLFAGIGGMRAAFESFGGRCVYTSESDAYAAKTYTANYSNGHRFDGDITLVDKKSIEKHDILLAGFPCQPFSIAGVSKKNSLGREHGFKDRAQGTLFYDILEVLAAHKPKAFLLENVKNLCGHDGGNTYRTIKGALEELDYSVFEQVIDARHWVPQHRERIFIIGFKEPLLFFNWQAVEKPQVKRTLGDILHNGDEVPEEPYTLRARGKTVVNPKYTLTDHLWQYLQAYAEKHRAAGNGFGYSVFGPDDVARTLSARYFKDGSEILIKQRGKNPRRLTPRECARLMGFDLPDPQSPSGWVSANTLNSAAGDNREPLRIPVSDTRAYKQFGNAVVVPVVRAIARQLLITMGVAV